MTVTRNGAHGPPADSKGLVDMPRQISAEVLNSQSNLYNNNFQFFNIFIIQITNILSCSTHTGIFSDQYEDDPDTSFTISKEISIGTALVLSLLVAGAVSSRKDISINDANEIRQQVNPWYRRFKTASGLGNSFGQLAGEFIALIPLIPAWLKKPISLVFGSIVGLVFGGVSLLFNSNPNEYNIKLSKDTPSDPKTDTMYVYLKENKPYYCIKDKNDKTHTVKIKQKDIKDQSDQQQQAYKEKFNQFKQSIIDAILTGKEELSYKDQSQLYDLVEDNKLKSFFKESIFYLGRDGWSKYAKAGLQLGAPVGSAIGAIIGFLLPIPGGMALGIAIGGALGGILGFAAFASLIPLYNKYKQSRQKTADHLIPLKSDDPLYKKPLITQNEKIPYRTNYIRIGTTVGSFLGTIAGFFIGMICIPVPGGALLGATLGTGIGALACSVVSGFIGPCITNFLKDNNYSSWDYGARTGSYLGGTTVGGIVTGILMILGIDVKVLKNVLYAAFGLLGSAIGGIYDAICTYGKKDQKKWKEEERYKNDSAPVLPWSQRLPTFATAGAFLGGIIGCILFATVPPLAILGIGIGIAIGAGVGSSVFTLIGAVFGNEIYRELHIFIEEKKTSANKDNSKATTSGSTNTMTHTLGIEKSSEASNIESLPVKREKSDLASQSIYAVSNIPRHVQPEKIDEEGFFEAAGFCNII